jgi:myo-inositol 2-dehydrogenase / D-chiro-inositol 1-dehydrogenase
VRNECTPTFFERFEEAFLREAQAFVTSVRQRRQSGAGQAGGASASDDNGATLADALEATRIGRALREALVTGQPVTL